MDKQAAIRGMMDSMAAGKATEVQDKFNSIMNVNAGQALNDYKEALSKTVFKNPDLVGMGLADGEDHVTEADPSAPMEPVSQASEIANEDV